MHHADICCQKSVSGDLQRDLLEKQQGFFLSINGCNLFLISNNSELGLQFKKSQN